jgi:transposase-like protein
MKHKHEDYKLSAVLYYLQNNSTYVETCRIFKCNEISLKRWIVRYKKEGSIKRHNRPAVAYKMKK